MFDSIQLELSLVATHLTIIEFYNLKLSTKGNFESLPRLNPIQFFAVADKNDLVTDYSAFCRLNTVFITDWDGLALRLLKSNMICEIGRIKMHLLDLHTKQELLMHQIGDHLSLHIMSTLSIDENSLSPETIYIDLIYQYCRLGYLESLNYLVNRVNFPSKLLEAGLETTAVYGQYHLAQYLLNELKVDPASNDNVAIRRASENGHFKLVQLLLKDDRVNPYACRSYPLRRAAKNGHLQVVKLLLEQPRMRGRGVRVALRYAKEHGYQDIVNVLEQRLNEQYAK
ncbi:hypothetical protein HDV06_005557 [Boothiomyces sp. JEL0866]|nr:hypothetical protein HDV06_005557 [Boothiomyces sp. JEL0866]